MQFFKKLGKFLKDVANDPRIPQRDKVVLLGLITWIISPIDLIPDWIPILGQLDDIVVLAIILDYFFEVLDTEVLLYHYPWGMKSFAFLRRSSRAIAALVPSPIIRKIWQYEGSPYLKK